MLLRYETWNSDESLSHSALALPAEEHRDDGAFKRYLPGPKTGGSLALQSCHVRSVVFIASRQVCVDFEASGCSHSKHVSRCRYRDV